MPIPFMDRWELNGTEVLLQDEGRDKANGVPVLDGNAKLPLKYITPAYSENLKVSPNDPYDMSLMEWAYYLSSDGYRNPGKAWSACEGITGGSHELRGIAYGNSLYVSASYTKIFTSLNGFSWQNAWNIPSQCNKLIFLNGLFLCLCLRNVYWSINGVTWNTCSGLSNSENYIDALYNNGHFVLRSASNVYWSTNGKSWNVVSSIGQNTAIYYEGGMWFACLYNASLSLYGAPWYSTDGETWTRGSGSSIRTDYIKYGNGVWVGSAYAERVCWSEDGINWTNTSTTDLRYATLDPDAIAYANGIWVLGGFNYSTNKLFPYWSTNGKTWTQGTGTDDLSPNFCMYANNLWLMRMGSYLYWSTDGKAWTLCTGLSDHTSEFNYANGIWLAGSNTGIYWSIDGKAWTQGLGENSNKVCRTPSYYGNSVYLSIDPSSPYGLWYSGGSLWTPN